MVKQWWLFRGGILIELKWIFEANLNCKVIDFKNNFEEWSKKVKSWNGFKRSFLFVSFIIIMNFRINKFVGWLDDGMLSEIPSQIEIFSSQF